MPWIAASSPLSLRVGTPQPNPKLKLDAALEGHRSFNQNKCPYPYTARPAAKSCLPPPNSSASWRCVPIVTRSSQSRCLRRKPVAERRPQRQSVLRHLRRYQRVRFQSPSHLICVPHHPCCSPRGMRRRHPPRHRQVMRMRVTLPPPLPRNRHRTRRQPRGLHNLCT